MLQYEYAREALEDRDGTRAFRLGTNPYEFGMIGSTDSPYRASRPRPKRNFFGKHSRNRARLPERLGPHPIGQASVTLEYKRHRYDRVGSRRRCGPTRKHARGSIFDAMMRREEVYATTGSAHDRPLLRGLRDFVAADAADTHLPRRSGYAKGVPMGGAPRRATRPAALRPSWWRPSKIRSRREPGPRPDHQGVSLDAESGKPTETRVRRRCGRMHAVCSTGPDGKPPAGGQRRSMSPMRRYDEHDRRACEMIGVWTDPEFDPDRPAASTTRGSSRSRRRAGRPTMRSASERRFRRGPRSPPRSAPTPRRSGTRP